MENLKNIQPIEDFNWDALEKGDSYGEVSKDDLVKTYDETLNTVKDKEVVMGTVTAMNKREVVVNIGFKSDGVVSMAEFRYNPDLKIGDEVEVYIENQEDKKGQLILSHKKARATRSWDRVNEALEKDEIIKGYIKCRTKGGMIVDVFGIEAFLNSRSLRSTRNSRTLLYLIKLLSKLNLNSRRKTSSPNLKKARYWKVQSRISLLTVYSSTWVA